MSAGTATATSVSAGGGCPRTPTLPTGPADAQLDAYFGVVLGDIGAPRSANNLAIMRRWANHEDAASKWGGGAFGRRANPLNTTQWQPGAWTYNGVGVRGYVSNDVGELMTARTLLDGHYPAVVEALQNDRPLSFWQSSQAIRGELDVWGGGHGYAAWVGC